MAKTAATKKSPVKAASPAKVSPKKVTKTKAPKKTKSPKAKSPKAESPKKTGGKKKVILRPFSAPTRDSIFYYTCFAPLAILYPLLLLICSDHQEVIEVISDLSALHSLDESKKITACRCLNMR
jgi:hypothetical protein